ncbi:phage baseplate assembly protein V [Rahnella aceris]|uniref:phage baseplate assembly protein V n=1 Tax=Rahnella sp. (strain Y9602) TaxID=2703885 RepID=UPI0020B79903|nr:phage baseplate assembly protein V [Rahnella aceris]
MNSMKALSRSVTNMISRAVVTGVNAAKKCQALQVELMADEPKDDVEHLEPYGFTSAPQLEAEAIALFPDGDRSHGVIIMVSDRRYRVTGLRNGEVCIYTDEGDTITLKRGRTIEVTTENYIVNTKKYTVNTTDYVVNSVNYTINATTAQLKATTATTTAATTLIDAAEATIKGSVGVVLTTPLVSASADMKAARDISDGKGSMQSFRAIYNTHEHQYNDGTTSIPLQPMPMGTAANDSDIERPTD